MRTILLALITCLASLPAVASYYDLAPNAPNPEDARECIVFDARYPYRTHGVYIATYPQNSRSQEGWEAEYYGGIVTDDRPKAPGQLIQYASWQMKGKDAPGSGIDLVHAGPYMSWQRSTWEGSSGSINGHWPNEQFKPAQWYRFVHRVWTPSKPVPHLGYAGVWMKNLETGEWHYLACFKFPAQLTGFNGMGGFVEYFSNDASLKAAVDFRNSYSECRGNWKSESIFEPLNSKDDQIEVTLKDGGATACLETTRLPIDPATNKRPEVEMVHQKISLEQPPVPAFLEEPRLTVAGAEYLGPQLIVRWQMDSKAAPQLGYEIAYLDETGNSGKITENDPTARQHVITLPVEFRGRVSVRLRILGIFDKPSALATVSATRAVESPAMPKAAAGVPGLLYTYYESPQPDSWTRLPDLGSQTPKRTGTVLWPDVTPRLRRTGYAFAFKGSLTVPRTGLYTFTLTTASGARLLIDRATVVEADGYRSIDKYPGTIALAAGEHALQLLQYQGGKQKNQADDFLQMTWAGPTFQNMPVPAANFTHTPTEVEPTFTVTPIASQPNWLNISARIDQAPAAVKRVEYYATDAKFDYFAQQGALSADYFLGDTGKPAETLGVPIWGGASRLVRGRLIYGDGRTVDSLLTPVSEPKKPGANTAGLVLTELEHHLYPASANMESGAVTIVGDSMNLLTRKVRGDLTFTARLVGITSQAPLADGTRMKDPHNWFSGLILRTNPDPRPGEPLGGSDIPYMSVMVSADGTTRHCDSTMINGAGNQLSPNVGRGWRWLRIVRHGPVLTALISLEGQSWKPVAEITLAKPTEEMEMGLVHYCTPSSTALLHWGKFDNMSFKPEASPLSAVSPVPATAAAAPPKTHPEIPGTWNCKSTSGWRGSFDFREDGEFHSYVNGQESSVGEWTVAETALRLKHRTGGVDVFTLPMQEGKITGRSAHGNTLTLQR